jgi:hypothetical protein
MRSGNQIIEPLWEVSSFETQWASRNNEDRLWMTSQETHIGRVRGLRWNLGDHQVQKLHRSARRRLDGRALRWAEVHARAARDFIILVVKQDASLSLHEIEELVLVGSRRFEFLAGFQPAQRRHHILGAAQFSVQHLGDFAFRRFISRKHIRINKSEALRLNPDSAFHAFPSKIVLRPVQNRSDETVGGLELEIEER